MTDGLKTTIHEYHFNTKIPAEAQAWAELKEKLKDHPHCMESHGGAMHYQPALDYVELTLEIESLFENQWNTAPVQSSKTGLRVFDWALDYNPYGNPHIKQGHYLDQTPEMREVRRNTVKCRYCGKQEPAQKGYVFCPHCTDSEYLKSKDLRLTRMLPVDYVGEIAPLSQAELDHLLPIYREAQLHGSTDRGRARRAKAYADMAKDYDNAIRDATNKRDGMKWLLDRGVNTSNVIYYNHTQIFSFGWRQPIDGETLSGLLDIISEFPCAYELKCADGRTLTGGGM